MDDPFDCHPRDNRIQFDPTPHLYTVDGCNFTSVTTVIESFFPKFESERMAQNCAGKGKYRNMDPEAVLKSWKHSAETAAQAGTHFHSAVEQYLARGTEHDTAEFKSWQNWYHDSRKRLGETVRLEWAIFDEEFQVAGTLDALFQSDRDLFFLLDWKRKRKMAKTAYGNERGFGPLSHLPNCDFSKAALQLNTYRWILQRRYQMDIFAMGIVQVHPENELNTHRIPPMDKEVEAMLGNWKNREVQGQP